MATAAPASPLDEMVHALPCTKKIVKDRTRVVHGRCYHDSCARGCRAQREGIARQGTAETGQSLRPCRCALRLTTGRRRGRGSLAFGYVVESTAESNLVREAS